MLVSGRVSRFFCWKSSLFGGISSRWTATSPGLAEDKVPPKPATGAGRGGFLEWWSHEFPMNLHLEVATAGEIHWSSKKACFLIPTSVSLPGKKALTFFLALKLTGEEKPEAKMPQELDLGWIQFANRNWWREQKQVVTLWKKFFVKGWWEDFFSRSSKQLSQVFAPLFRKGGSWSGCFQK